MKLAKGNCKIIRILEMPDQTTTIILQGVKRMELEEIVDTIPYLKGVAGAE